MRSETRVMGYNGGAMLLHWAIALLIVLQLAGGFLLARTAFVPAGLAFTAIQWHKTVGLTILALTLARIAWRLMNPPPEGAPMRPAEARLAGLVHFLFYALMLAVPLSGWLMVSASPRAIPTLLFLSPALPFVHLPAPDGGAVEGVAVRLHTLLAYSFLGLLGLHVAGALKHSIVDRAPSLSRMLPVGRLARPGAARGAVAVALLAALGFLGAGVGIGRLEAAAPVAAPAVAGAPAAPAAATGWQVDRAASTLGFDTTFSGQPVAGTIGSFDAAIRFDPADLANARADISLDPTTITVADPFVQSNVPGPDGFDAAKHPRVTVRLDRFEPAADGFVGRGTVGVKDKTVPVEVPFTFAKNADGTASASGTAVLDRVALGLGLGNDPDGQWLAREVRVRFSLRAAPAAAPGGA